MKVDDTFGLGFVLVDSIKSLGLHIDDIRGQDCDNGSNMKGRHKRFKGPCLVLVVE
jgi:hypothetical protein